MKNYDFSEATAYTHPFWMAKKGPFTHIDQNLPFDYNTPKEFRYAVTLEPSVSLFSRIKTFFHHFF